MERRKIRERSREWERVGDRRKRREWRGERSGRDREWERVGDRRKRREWRGERSGRRQRMGKSRSIEGRGENGGDRERVSGRGMERRKT